MKKILIAALALALLLALAACGAGNPGGEPAPEPDANVENAAEAVTETDGAPTDSAPADTDAPVMMAGGWSVTESPELTDEAQAAFDKAMEELVGVNYEPLALLGTQVVAGMNYCILCEATVVYPDATPYYALVYVYQDLEGGAAITNIVDLDIGAVAESGVIEPADPGEALMGGWYVDRESTVECDDSVMHLASQVVAGMNHCVLCEGYDLVFLYEDLEGTVTVTSAADIDIAALSQPVEATE